MTLFRVYTRVLRLLSPESRLAAVLIFANIALAAALFVEPMLFGRIVDTLTNARAGGVRWDEITILTAIWVGFGLFTIVCGVLVALYADRLSHRRRQAVLTDYYEHVLQLPQSFHGGAHSGRLMKVMQSGTDALWSIWIEFFRDDCAAVVAIFVLVPVSLFINWQLGLLLVGVCIVFGILTMMVFGKTESMQRDVERHYSDLAERASDTLGNVALVQGFARVEAEVTGLRDVVDRLLAAQIPVLSWWAVVSILTRASTTLTMLAIFLVGLWLHLDGKVTIGEIVGFMGFAGLVIGRLERVVRMFNRLVGEGPRLNDFFGVLDTEPAVRDRPDAIDPGEVRGLVEFNHVSYSYDGKRDAVANLKFVVLPGETIALVGATGAGKSTALALLHRAFDPRSGTIQVDGMDLRGIKLAALRRNIGVVYQETLLLNRSIADNLRVGKPDATMEEMRAACEKAQALDFIERLPQGFDAPVGERGRFLSGGERQRLSIARAFLKNPPILILDEATSALDATTEAKVQAALDEVMKGRTTFVIAHRLATVRNATRTVVFENGRIVESGTFDELVALNGRFAELARAQFMIPQFAPDLVPIPPQDDAPPPAVVSQPAPAPEAEPEPAAPAAETPATMEPAPAEPEVPTAPAVEPAATTPAKTASASVPDKPASKATKTPARTKRTKTAATPAKPRTRRTKSAS